MSAQGGEERVLTLYADVHYYFNAPTPRPLSHRFDKGSYFYLHRNVSRAGGRVEIANNVGKPEQDAFTGSLDSIKIKQSHKHPTLCTFTVDGFESTQESGPPPIQHPEHHWRLPNTDPRNEGKYLFRLHTVDVYFWTAQDADSFIATVSNFLQPGQVEVLDAPTPPRAPEQAMSPVVQKLEKVAVQDPAYGNGQTRNSRSASTTLSPPPTRTSETPTKDAVSSSTSPASFQPLAYNPAAPPAPEPIKHREKTPPPDIDADTGLASAAHRDQTPAIMPSPSRRQNSSTQLPYPSQTPNAGVRVSSSPYAPAPTSAPPPTQSAPGATGFPAQKPTAFSPPPADPNAQFMRRDTAPLDSPTTQILGQSYIGSPHEPLQHLQPQYAEYRPEAHGGYSDFRYEQAQRQNSQTSHGSEYDVHSQVYRPTEHEHEHHKHHKQSDATPAQPGKLEQTAGKVDKGVNRFLKKLEKKIG